MLLKTTGRGEQISPADLLISTLENTRKAFGPGKIRRQTSLHVLNPLKWKMVDRPKDRPWGSFYFYSIHKHGLIRVDPVN